VVNLVVNALEALVGNGTITIRTGCDRGGWIEVADTGPGMSPDVQSRVFEPFFTTKADGTGLGLATVYGFVQAHGGRVSLETAQGRGTCVRLWFPEIAEAPTPVPVTQAPSPAQRLLLVENDPSARQALGRLLESEGFVVRAAATGDEALESLGAWRPDALIVDLRLPGRDGVVVAHRARAEMPALPVVFLSALGSAAEALPAPNAPVGALDDEPVDVARLVTTLNRMIRPPQA